MSEPPKMWLFAEICHGKGRKASLGASRLIWQLVSPQASPAAGRPTGVLWASEHQGEVRRSGGSCSSSQAQRHGTVPQGLVHQLDREVRAHLLGQDHPGEEAKKGQIFLSDAAAAVEGFS